MEPCSRIVARSGDSLPFGVFALLDPAQGRAIESLGATSDLGQFHLEESYVRFFRIWRYPACHLQYLRVGHTDGYARNRAGYADRIHHQSQFVSRRALSVLLRLGTLGYPRHRLGGRPVYRLHPPTASALRDGVDSFRSLFNQGNADRIFPGRVDFQEYPPGTGRCEPHYRRQSFDVAQRCYRPAGALGPDRRLVFYFYRRHS